jgi:hypothetical protein
MQWMAKLPRREAAAGLVKRILKDTLVSGTATICASLALSAITKTTEPPAQPTPEIIHAVEIEPVRPMPAAVVSLPLAAAPESRNAAVSGEDAVGAPRSAAVKDAAARPRRPAAAQGPVQPATAAKTEARISLPAPAPAPLPTTVVASAPLDLLAMTRLPVEAKPESAWSMWSAVSMARRTGQTVATTAVDVTERVTGLTSAVWTAVLR